MAPFALPLLQLADRSAEYNTGRGCVIRFLGSVRDENNESPVEKYGDSADCDLYGNVGMLDSDD